MKINKCPKCGSGKYSRERRPNGYTICKDCGLKIKSSEWDKEILNEESKS